MHSIRTKFTLTVVSVNGVNLKIWVGVFIFNQAIRKNEEFRRIRNLRVVKLIYENMYKLNAYIFIM